MNIRKVLKFLHVIQTVSNKDGKLGRGFIEAQRLNPYNPLSYITIVLGFILGIILFGIYGFWKEVDTTNPFKWN